MSYTPVRASSAFAAVGYNNVSTDYWRNRWTEERPGNRYPSLNGEGKTEMSSYYVEDGSYLRLKNLTVG